MNDVALLRHEIRRCGPSALALPVLTAAGIIALSLVAAGLSGGQHEIGPGAIRLIAGTLSVVFPVPAGLAAASAVGRERLMELQLTMPTDYRTTALRRLGVITLVVTGAAGAVVGTLVACGQWQHPARGLFMLLVPLAPCALLVGTALYANVVLRSAAGASTVVVGVWLFQLMVLDRYLTPWQVNRVALLLGGVMLTAMAIRAMRITERLVEIHDREGDGE